MKNNLVLLFFFAFKVSVSANYLTVREGMVEVMKNLIG